MVWLLDEGFDYQSAAGVIDEVAVWRSDAATAAGMEIGALAGLGNKISRDSPETPSATSAGSRVAGSRCHESHDDRFVISLCLCDADLVPGPLIGRAFAVGEARELQQSETIASKREIDLLREEVAQRFTASRRSIGADWMPTAMRFPTQSRNSLVEQCVP